VIVIVNAQTITESADRAHAVIYYAAVVTGIDIPPSAINILQAEYTEWLDSICPGRYSIAYELGDDQGWQRDWIGFILDFDHDADAILFKMKFM
jgi:hypothetical protein